jgi:tRNA(Ile)-lysidine synthase
MSTPNPALAPLAGLALDGYIGVAYSGGADSTALLLAATEQWPGRIHAIHIHHGLQAAADDFVRVCSALCQRLGVPLQLVHVDAAHASGQSPEDAARRARYGALAKVARDKDLSAVLLGQHADDQVETLLIALGRGAGLPGLSAMPAWFDKDSARFCRPLLAVASSSLRDWLLREQLEFIDDPTNTDHRYTRNHIRTRLLPAIKEVFPHFRATFARSACHAAQAQELLVELASEDLARVGLPPAIKGLQALSRARQANLLRHWLLHAHRATPSTAQMEQLLAQIAVCSTHGHRIHLKVASGHVIRNGPELAYLPPELSPG